MTSNVSKKRFKSYNVQNNKFFRWAEKFEKCVKWDKYNIRGVFLIFCLEISGHDKKYNLILLNRFLWRFINDTSLFCYDGYNSNLTLALIDTNLLNVLWFLSFIHVKLYRKSGVNLMLDRFSHRWPVFHWLDQ